MDQIIRWIKAFPTKSVIAVLLSLLLVAESAMAAPGPVPAVSGFSFSLPPAIGFVTDAYFPHGKAKGYQPDVVLIQDLHVNRSVQFAISKILNRLKNLNWLPSQIAIEGATGPVGIGPMQRLFTPDVRKQAADYLVEQGEMRGDMHFAVTEAYGDLYGVETPETYRATLDMYRRSYAQRTTLQRELDRLQEALKLLSHERNLQVRENLALLRKDVESVHQLVTQQVTREELGTVIRQATVAIDHLKTILPETPSPLMGEGGDGGGSRQGAPPTSILPHKGGGSFKDGLLQPLSAAVNFYVLALMRDEDLFKNLMQLRETAKQRTSVLVTGGFHTAGLADQFKRKGLSYIVLTPHVRRHTQVDERLYAERMLGHHLTLDQIRDGRDWTAMEMAAPEVNPLLTQQQLIASAQHGVAASQHGWLADAKPIIHAVGQQLGFLPSGLFIRFRNVVSALRSHLKTLFKIDVRGLAFQTKSRGMPVLLGVLGVFGLGALPHRFAGAGEVLNEVGWNVPDVINVAHLMSSSQGQSSEGTSFSLLSLLGLPFIVAWVTTVAISAVLYIYQGFRRVGIRLKWDSALWKSLERVLSNSKVNQKRLWLWFFISFLFKFGTSSPIDHVFGILSGFLLALIGTLGIFGDDQRNGPPKRPNDRMLPAWLLIPLLGLGALLAGGAMPTGFAGMDETTGTLAQMFLFDGSQNKRDFIYFGLGLIGFVSFLAFFGRQRKYWNESIVWENWLLGSTIAASFFGAIAGFNDYRLWVATWGLAAGLVNLLPFLLDVAFGIDLVKRPANRTLRVALSLVYASLFGFAAIANGIVFHSTTTWTLTSYFTLFAIALNVLLVILSVSKIFADKTMRWRRGLYPLVIFGLLTLFNALGIAGVMDMGALPHGFAGTGEAFREVAGTGLSVIPSIIQDTYGQAIPSNLIITQKIAGYFSIASLILALIIVPFHWWRNRRGPKNLNSLLFPLLGAALLGSLAMPNAMAFPENGGEILALRTADMTDWVRSLVKVEDSPWRWLAAVATGSGIIAVYEKFLFPFADRRLGGAELGPKSLKDKILDIMAKVLTYSIPFPLIYSLIIQWGSRTELFNVSGIVRFTLLISLSLILYFVIGFIVRKLAGQSPRNGNGSGIRFLMMLGVVFLGYLETSSLMANPESGNDVVMALNKNPEIMKDLFMPWLTLHRFGISLIVLAIGAFMARKQIKAYAISLRNKLETGRLTILSPAEVLRRIYGGLFNRPDVDPTLDGFPDKRNHILRELYHAA